MLFFDFFFKVFFFSKLYFYFKIDYLISFANQLGKLQRIQHNTINSNSAPTRQTTSIHVVMKCDIFALMKTHKMNDFRVFFSSTLFRFISPWHFVIHFFLLLLSYVCDAFCLGFRLTILFFPLLLHFFLFLISTMI